MTTLQYAKLGDVISASKLGDPQISQFNRMSCDDVFTSFTNLFVKANQETADLEKQLILYMRCGEIANIITGKNGFDTFTKKEALKKYFTLLCDKIDFVQKKLADQYSLRETRNGFIETQDRTIVPSIPINAVTAPKSKPGEVTPPLLITPRELIRLTEKPHGLSAVILDIRSDQEACSVTVPPNFEVTVIVVPRDIIVAGLIFNVLRQNLPVASRALLQRVSSSDKVVILDDKTPPLLNGKIDSKSHAGILSMAIYEYNREKPKCPLLCFSGGFDTWKLEYPTYIEHVNKISREPLDSLDNLVRHYKKSCLAPVQYPDLSPKRVEIVKPPPPSLIQDSDKYPLIDDEIGDENIPAALTKDLGKLEFESVTLPRPHEIDRGTKPRMQTRDQDVSSLPKEPAQVYQNHPSIDRTIKPLGENKHDIPKLNGGQKPGVLPMQPKMPNAPIPNRATKPSSVLSENTQRSLRNIYDSMASNIVSNSKRRSTSSVGGLTGLSNMGNTCFMNASLQALFHSPGLHDIFTAENFLAKVNDQNKMGTRGVISACFSALMDHIWSGAYEAIRPERFLSLFSSEVNSMFGDRQQHDASEFQMFLLDALHEDTNMVHKRISFQQDYKGGNNIVSEGCEYIKKSSQFSLSPVSNIFKYHMVSETVCSICGERSANFEDNTQLSVEIPNTSYSSISLDACLNSHFSEISLDGNERWNCPRCKKAQPSRRTTKLWVLPSVLIIHLKRFSFIDGDYQKNQISVNFDPNRLDLKGHLHARAQPCNANYRLFSVTNHRGRLNSGHYTSTTYHSTLKEWYRFDDESVYKTSASNIDSSDAYILYYMRV